MNILDANVLVYALNEDALHHVAAHSWLSRALGGHETVGLPWLSALAFLRISTNARLFPRPLTTEQACDALAGWRSSPVCVTVDPGPRHLDLLRDLLSRPGCTGSLTNDAHLAALALEARGRVVSFDRDFARFDVEVVVPGAAQP